MVNIFSQSFSVRVVMASRKQIVRACSHCALAGWEEGFSHPTGAAAVQPLESRTYSARNARAMIGRTILKMCFRSTMAHLFLWVDEEPLRDVCENASIPPWNSQYHLFSIGFPARATTLFPCPSGLFALYYIYGYHLLRRAVF